jgi:hypothetical protein
MCDNGYTKRDLEIIELEALFPDLLTDAVNMQVAMLVHALAQGTRERWLEGDAQVLIDRLIVLDTVDRQSVVREEHQGAAEASVVRQEVDEEGKLVGRERGDEVQDFSHLT